MQQAPLCDVKQMKITKRGKPFVLDFIPEVRFIYVCTFCTKIMILAHLLHPYASTTLVHYFVVEHIFTFSLMLKPCINKLFHRLIDLAHFFMDSFLSEGMPVNNVGELYATISCDHLI